VVRDILGGLGRLAADAQAVDGRLQLLGHEQRGVVHGARGRRRRPPLGHRCAGRQLAAVQVRRTRSVAPIDLGVQRLLLFPCQ